MEESKNPGLDFWTQRPYVLYKESMVEQRELINHVLRIRCSSYQNGTNKMPACSKHGIGNTFLDYPNKGISTPKFFKGPSPQFSACHDITMH